MKQKSITHFAWLLLVAALALPSGLWAQVNCDNGSPSVVANGDSSSYTTSYFPGWGYYKYSYTEVIVPASQLGEVGTLMALQFFPTSGNTNGSFYTNCQVYLGHTSLENLSGGFIQDLSSFELVYTGDLAYTAGQWKTVVFDEPFLYDGESNLVVAILRNTGSYGSNGKTFMAYNAGAALGRYVQVDASPYTIGSITGGSTATTVPVYRFISCPTEPVACDRVVDLVVSSTTSESVTLSWSDTSSLNDGATYTIYNGEDVVASGITDFTYTVDGLEASTQYTFGVVAECAEGDLSRARTIVTRTACGDVSLPYEMNFDNLAANTMPDCWTQLSPTSSSSNEVWAYSVNPYGGTGMCLRFNYGTPAGNVVALPPTASPLNTVQMRFKARPESNVNQGCGTIYVGYVTSLTDASSFVAVDSVRYNDFLTSDYMEFEVPLTSAPDGARAAFRHKAMTSNWYFNVDDVVLEPVPTCLKVSGLQVSNITSDGATLSWTDNDNASATYSVWNGTTPMAQNIAGTSVTLMGLTANTFYNLSVRADCAADDSSRCVGIGFRTLCDATQPLPYAEGFEGYDNLSFPPCMQREGWYVNGSYTYPMVYNNQPRTGLNRLHMYYQSGYGTVGEPQLAMSPVLEGAGNNLHISFWANFSSNIGTDILEVGVVPADGSGADFQPLMFIAADQVTRQVYAQYECYTDAEASTDNVRIAFRWTSNSNSNVGIDDILVEVASDCRMPMRPRVSEVDYSSALLSWTDNTSRPHVVRYATFNNASAASAQTLGVEAGNSSLRIDDLQSNTTYYAWVATICDGDTLDWLAFPSFTTHRDCYSVINPVVSSVGLTSAVINWEYDTEHGRQYSSVSVSLTDISNPTEVRTFSFDGTAALLPDLEPSHNYVAALTTQCGDYSSLVATVSFATLDCGKIEGTGGTAQYGPFNAFHSYGYSQTLYPSELASAIEQIDGLQFRLNGGSPSVPTRTLDIYMANTDLTSIDLTNYVSYEDLTLVAQDVSFNTASAGWKTINFDTPFNNERGRNLVVAVVNKTGQGANFMWRVHDVEPGHFVYWFSSDAAVDPTNPVVSSPGTQNVVADITLIGNCDLSGCRPPVLAVDAVDAWSVGLAWISGNEEDDWVIEYKHASDTEWMEEGNTSEPFYIVEGLEPATNYLFRVGAICGDEVLYSNVVNVHTGCDQVEFPYTEGFEEWSAEVFPLCWQRAQTLTSSNVTYPRVITSSAAAHSGNKGIETRATSSNPTVLVSPEVGLQPNLIHIEVWYKLATNNTTMSLQVGLMSDPNDLSTFVPVKTFTPENILDWQMFECYTEGVAFDAEQVYVAFRVLSTSSTGFNVYLDDISINLDNQCHRPASGEVVSHGWNSVNLAWVEASNAPSSYSVLISHDYNNIGLEDDIFATSTTNTATVGGLEPSTEYYAWVASECNGDVSDYLFLGSFTTDDRCMPILDLEVADVDNETAVLVWQYDTVRGVDATGAIVYALPLDSVENPSAQPLVVEASGMGAFLTQLQSGTTYKAWVQTLCDYEGTVDTSVNTQSVVFTTRTCAVADTDAILNTTQIPFRENGARHSYSQMLYPPDVLGGMDSIRGVAFKVNSGSDGHDHPFVFDMYIGSTSYTSLGRYTYVPTSRMVKVVEQDTLDVRRNGWFVIPFDTVFAPNPDSNIVLTVVNNTGTAYSAYLYWNYHNSTSNSTLHYYNNSSDDLVPDNLQGSYSTFNYTPDVMFVGNCEYGCKAPSVMVESATQQSLTIRWTAEPGESEWLVGYNAGDSLWTEVLATTNPYTITDLSPSSLYNVRVGRICISEAEDEEGNPIADTLYSSLYAYTLCGPASVPFTPLFSAALGPCWSVSHTASVYAETSTGTLYMASPYYYAILPEIDQNLTDVQLKLNFSLTGNNYSLMVGATDDDGAHITWVDTLTVESSYTPVETVTYFINYQGNGRRIVIANGSGTYYTRISGVTVEPRDVCFPVDSLKAFANVGCVNLSWTHDPEEAAYFVEYRPTTSEAWTALPVADSMHVFIRGLQHSTAYVARVRSVCSVGDTSRWIEVAFTTPCDAVAMPFDEDFEALSGNGSFTQILSCWNFYETPYDDVMAGIAELEPMTTYRWSTSNAISGEGLRLNVYGDINNVHHWAVTPAIAVTDNEPLVALDYSVTFYNEQTTAADPDDRFMMLITRDGGQTWQSLAMWGSDAVRDTFQLQGQYNTPIHVEVPMQGFDGDTVRIAFYGQSTVPGADIYVNIDNLHIGHRVCPQPVVDSLSHTTSTLSVYFDADAAEVAIVEGEWDEATASPIAATGSSHTFSTLAEGTTYSVGVRNVCDDGYRSKWVVRSATTDTTVVVVGILTADLANARLTLSPNPATEQVKVRIEGLTEAATVELLDLSGRLVGSTAMQQGEALLTLSSVPQGTYFVRVVSAHANAIGKLVVR